MIVIKMEIHPGGMPLPHNVISLGSIAIWSEGNRHRYSVSLNNKGAFRSISGSILKTKSGHRNIMHVMKNVLDDINLEELGENYVHVLDEIRIKLNAPNLRAAAYPGE